VLLGNGDGTFQPPPTAITPQSSWPATSTATTASNIARLGNVQLGNGDGTFQPPQPYSSPGAETLAAGDFDGDGRQDLVAAYHGIWDAATLSSSAVT